MLPSSVCIHIRILQTIIFAVITIKFMGIYFYTDGLTNWYDCSFDRTLESSDVALYPVAALNAHQELEV